MTHQFTFRLDSPLRLYHNKRVTITADTEKNARDNIRAMYPTYYHDLVKG